MFQVGQNQGVRAVKAYFDFLIVKHGFKGPFLWKHGREMGYSFVNGQIVFNLAFDGQYDASIVKLQRIFPQLESGEQNLLDIDPEDRASKNILLLIPKAEREEFYKYRLPDAQLSAFSQILKMNPEILRGDWDKYEPEIKSKKGILSGFFRRTH